MMKAFGTKWKLRTHSHAQFSHGICNDCLKKLYPEQYVDEKKIEDALLPIKCFSNLPESAPLHLLVKGTNFQIKVWEALMAIPFGAAVTYQDIANHIGMPGATRAVGTAVGKNPIPFIIPCHRVIRKMGEFGQYGGGRERKMAMITWESARRTANEFS
jgi:O-6-methylguanine DNA methyltransferase